MAFCKQCGKQIPDNANACPFCGTMVAAQAPQQAAPQQNYQQAPGQGYAAPQQGYPQQGYQQPGYGYAQQPGYAAPQQQAYVSPEMDIQQSRGIAWLSYVGLLFLIPMFVRKYSDYTRFHVKQGATLFCAQLAYWIPVWIIMAIIDGATDPITRSYYNGYRWVVTQVAPHSAVYYVFYSIFALISGFFVVLEIMGIVNAATGKKRELLLIGKIPWIAKLLDVTVYK